jgi:uncharacterized repeat protein (TIGR01451 family)
MWRDVHIIILLEKGLLNAARILASVLLAFLTLFISVEAQAQINYTNTVDGTVNETATPCTNPLIRTFNVPEIYSIADVNIGVLMSHTYRGDLRMFLLSPQATQITLIQNTADTQNNFNVLFDDSAAALITTHTTLNDTATATTVVPAYQRTFRPLQALSAFNGQNANGTWTLSICDSLNVDSGTFFQSNLVITPQPATIGVSKASAVLSDGVSGSNPKSLPAAVVRYCITITNNGPGIAANIVGTDIVPLNTAYVAESMRSGTDCASAATVEDDNSTGADETDPYGASISGTTISISTASMASAASFAITFQTTIN